MFLIGIVFVAGATFGAFIAFVVAGRTYDRGYRDGLMVKETTRSLNIESTLATSLPHSAVTTE